MTDERGVDVATSSITKEVIVKDDTAFIRLLSKAEEIPERKATKDSPSLNKGREALKRFSLR